MKRVTSLCLIILLFTSVYAENLDEVMDGFDDEPQETKVETTTENEDNLMEGFEEDDTSIEAEKQSNSDVLEGFTGKLTQQTAYAYKASSPHNNFTSFKSSLLLDYEHKFANDFKFKINAKAYDDSIYKIRGKENYSKDEKDAFKNEIELFDAYLQGKILDNLDFKVGRQVVVWGRSDTIRITDILNPIDNRRPAMVDIEDLRLPVAMIKLDYFIGNWRITPMAILEQRFSKFPPSSSLFNPSPASFPSHEKYKEVTPALSIGAEFSGWDVNFYASKVRDDRGFFDKGKIKHYLTNMVGVAFNLLKGSWLLKSEVAYFDTLKYTTAPTKTFQRVDSLIGLEYNGIPDTLFSYDISLRTITNYDNRLIFDPFEVEENSYQQAFRVSSDFINATLHANYLVSLFGKKLEEGGFQRAWIQYDIGDSSYVNFGVVDYIKGSKLFDNLKNSDMLFTDITYDF